mmetsp:Transcript_125266/g.365875  ORF Transcript_125266/g.365875 Transcript_125266/m.365875 type:complete len:540 (-) Transcript_125266:55-1674(-)
MLSVIDLCVLFGWIFAWQVAGEADGVQPSKHKPCSGPGRPSQNLRRADARAGYWQKLLVKDSEQDRADDASAAASDDARDVLANVTERNAGADEDEDSAIHRTARRFLVRLALEEKSKALAGEPSEERLDYMNAKLAIDLQGVKQFAVPPTLLPRRSSSSQVAFLFLTMNELDFEEVWDRFFSAARAGRYSIYVHRAAMWREGDQQSNRGAYRSITWPPPLGRWGAIDVPPVETGWCALMGAQIALLAAALQDTRNQQFVFLSHNTVPLKSFAYVYRQLVVNSPLTSKFCFAEPAYYKLATTETIRNELRRTCVFRDFYRSYNPRTLKHHQWIVLARDHAESLVRNAEKGLQIWRESWEAVAPDLTAFGEGCSDEAVPVTALLADIKERGRSTGNTWADLTRLGVEQQCLTYVLWRHCFGDTELNQSAPISKELDIVRKHGEFRMLTDQGFDFFKSTLKHELNGYPTVFKRLSMEYLSKLVNQGFMFARKFTPDMEVLLDSRSVPLAIALSILWEELDEEAASQRVWARLSTEGVPRPL